jgi:hypothetical protein
MPVILGASNERLAKVRMPSVRQHGNLRKEGLGCASTPRSSSKQQMTRGCGLRCQGVRVLRGRVGHAEG